MVEHVIKISMDCTCTSPLTHSILVKALLCGPLEPLTDYESDQPSSDIEVPHLSSKRKPKPKEKHLKAQRTFRDRIVQNIRNVNYMLSSHWHLDNAVRCGTGFLGRSQRLYPNMPRMPKSSTQEEHLTILVKNGYRVVPAPV